MVTKDYVVIGGGVVGASTAYELAKQGKEVLLIERNIVGAPNPISSSGDHSKVFRQAYPDVHYSKMCQESLGLWREIENSSGKQLYVPCGMLVVGKHGSEGALKWARDSADVMAELKLPHEMLSKKDLLARYPQISDRETYDHALLDKESGFIYAQDAVKAIGGLAKQVGVEVWEHTEVLPVKMNGTIDELITTRGTVVPREAVVFAAGFQNLNLFPALQQKGISTRQQTIYVRPKDQSAFMPEEFPIFVSLGEGYYAFPIHNNGCTKISNHDLYKKNAIDARAIKYVEDTVDGDFIKNALAFFRDYVPRLADGEIVEGHSCVYTNATKGDFILDRIGNVVIASACSGHGFKFGPLTGQIAAQLALGNKHRMWDERFTLAKHGDASEIQLM